MLTEKEKSELTQAVSLAVGAQIATLSGHVEAIKVDVGYIREKGDKTYDQTTKTNGRVNGHDTEIRLINSYIKNRATSCPQKEAIDQLVADKKSRKVRFVYDVVVVSVAFIAFYVSVLTFKDYMTEKKFVQKDMTEIQAESKKTDKVQDLKINNNTKARKDSEVDKAFEKSLKENK